MKKLFQNNLSKIILSILFTVIFLCSQAQGWQQTSGPGGGQINCFAKLNSDLYAGTENGVYKSIDQGISWTEVNNGLLTTAVKSLVVKGTKIFAGTYGGGVFVSADYGVSWTATGAGPSISRALVTDGTNIFVGTSNGIFKSVDAGATWSTFNSVGLTNTDIYSLAISGTSLYAGTDNGLFKSPMNNVNWSAVSLTGFPTGLQFKALCVSGSNIFAGSQNNNIAFSHDNGATWVNIGSTSSVTIEAIMLKGTDLFIGSSTGFGIYKSTISSGGVWAGSWVQANVGFPAYPIGANSVFVYSLFDNNTQILSGSKYDGIYKSNNNGASWAAANIGLTKNVNSDITAINFNTSSGNLLAGTRGYGLFKSSNNGDLWTDGFSGLNAAHFWGMASSGYTVFAGTSSGVKRSLDGGLTWSGTSSGTGISLSFAINSDGTKVFAGGSGGVYLSTDLGITWTAKNSGLPGSYVESMLFDNATNRVYAGTRNGIFVSTDYGNSWTSSNTGLSGSSNNTINCIVKSGSNLVVSSDNKIYYSTNNGTSWTATTQQNINDMVSNGTNVYACGSQGVFKSSDNGVSWTAMNIGLTNVAMFSLRITASATHLFLGTHSTGVWKYDLNACPTIPPITGATAICVGATLQLSNTLSGGVWTSLNNRASVNTVGLVTGLNAGTASIQYTVTNGNCTGFSTVNFTVNAIPPMPSIAYALGTPNPQSCFGGGFRRNNTFTVVGSPSGGVWSSTGAITVASNGFVTTSNTSGPASLTYTITVNGCSNRRIINGFVGFCRGVNNGQLTMDNGQWTIYPNPAKSFINLNVETLVGAGSIVVTDLYGKQIATQTLSMGTNTIDVSRLSKGMYFVSMITSEGKSTKKLVVE